MSRDKKNLFYLLTFFIFLFLLILPSFALEKKAAILYSEPTIRVFSWHAENEFRSLKRVLDILKVNYTVVKDDDIQNSLKGYDILILANTRCMSVKACENIRDFVKNEGRIFATYQASYRDENNRKVTLQNNFQLADLFGADFYRWTNAPPKCEYIIFKDDFSGFKKDQKIQLARNTAMLVKPNKDTSIIAEFLNEDLLPSENGGNSASIIINKDSSCIYSGENLFTTENSASVEVLTLIKNILDKLVPGISKIDIKELKVTDNKYFTPYIPKTDIKKSERKIKVWVGDYSSPSLSSDNDFYVMDEKQKALCNKGILYHLEPVDILMKNPYIALYDSKKRLLGRFNNSCVISNIKDKKIVNILKINANGTYNIRSYRGEISAYNFRSKIRFVNELGIEEYIAGVLPNEMPQQYPPEALKTMAVINRTFAVSNLSRHKDEMSDLCSTVHCQVYTGVLSEENSTTKAVNDTMGEYIYYNDNYAATTFHSSCGGVTEKVKNVWDYHEPEPYLISVADSPVSKDFIFNNEDEFRQFIDDPPLCYCRDAGRFRWKEKYSLKELEKLFKESLPVYFKDFLDPGVLKDVKIIQRSPHGRVQCIEIIFTHGSYKVYKDPIRWLFSKGKIGLGGLQSTLFYIEKDDDGNYLFVGGGWGHGVGMCQDGSCQMARDGFNYKQIIEHYYPGCVVKK